MTGHTISLEHTGSPSPQTDRIEPHSHHQTFSSINDWKTVAIFRKRTEILASPGPDADTCSLGPCTVWDPDPSDRSALPPVSRRLHTNVPDESNLKTDKIGQMLQDTQVTLHGCHGGRTSTRHRTLRTTLSESEFQTLIYNTKCVAVQIFTIL
jgi:hypothetical protein